MKIATKMESKDWGCTLYLDDKSNGDMYVVSITEHYSKMPVIINNCCEAFIKQKGRGKEKILIRPTLKKLLIDLHDFLECYGNDIAGHITKDIPLEFDLLGLTLPQCLGIFSQCKERHPEKIIETDYALFGAMLKEFYLNVKGYFLPDDFREVCNSMGKTKIINDYYSLGEAVTKLWENEPREKTEKALVMYDLLSMMAKASEDT